MTTRGWILASLFATAVFGVAMACGSSDDSGGATPPPDGATGSETGTPAVEAGGSDGGGEGGRACAKTAPFADDFENKAKLDECWDGLVVTGGGTNLAELSNALGDKQGTVFHLLLNGATEAYLKKTFTPAVPAPAALAYRWRVDKIGAPGTEGDKGYTALAVRYKHAGGEATANVFIGVRGENVNPFVEKPDGHVPIHELETGTWHVSEIEIRGSTLTIRSDKTNVFKRTATLAGDVSQILELRIGLVALDPSSAEWELRYDDVTVDKAP